jgi:hypothetical protein
MRQVFAGYEQLYIPPGKSFAWSRIEGLFIIMRGVTVVSSMMARSYMKKTHGNESRKIRTSKGHT